MCVLESYVILEAAPTFYPDLNILSIMAFVDRPAMVKAPPFQGINSDFNCGYGYAWQFDGMFFLSP